VGGRSWLLVVMVLPFGSPLAAQAVVTGTVREDSSGRPLPRIEVILEGTSRRASTDDAGRYSFPSIPRGSHTLLFRAIGFLPTRVPIRIAQHDTVWANAVLSARAQLLQPVEVEGETRQPRGFGLEAFEERRKMGFGAFIDSTILRQSEHYRLDEVLRRHSNTWMVPGRDGEAFAISRRKVQVSRAGGPATCPMQVIVDGVTIFYPRVMDPMNVPPDLRREFSVSELEAIEVYYGGAGTPVEFSGTRGECGTIVLWTRRSRPGL
jgi:hypothetical protein